MKPTAEQVGTKWPPTRGELVTYHGPVGLKQGILQEIRWGLVWRDFVLEDGRVIPEHKILGCPQPPVWREAGEVSAEEREACEERLVAMAESGLDPRDKDQAFWAEMNQYLAYTYMRFQAAGLNRIVGKKG
jgi:hypothetical protein